MEKYWFVVNPDVFIWKKQDKVLAYDSKHFVRCEYDTCPRFDEIYQELINPENLYTVELTEADKSISDFQYIIHSLCQIGCARLISQEEEPERPVSLFPLLGVQRSRDKFRKRQEMVDFENFMNYLKDLTVYLNGSGLSTDFYTRQVPYFLQEGTDLAFPSLDRLLKSIAHASVSNIRICGNNVLNYPHLSSLVDRLDRIHAMKRFYVSCQQLEEHPELWPVASSGQFKFMVIVDSEHPLLESVLLPLLENQLHVEWLFYVASEKEYEQAIGWIELYKIESCGVKPIYTGDNQDFFSQYVYLAEEDIKSIRLNKRQIFANQTLNTNDFGKLIISPEGYIHAGVNDPSCGHIDTDSMLSILRNELINGDAWFRIRSEEPCSDCLYQWLCPSPSNYEFVVGKQNLCFKF